MHNRALACSQLSAAWKSTGMAFHHCHQPSPGFATGVWLDLSQRQCRRRQMKSLSWSDKMKPTSEDPLGCVFTLSH